MGVRIVGVGFQSPDVNQAWVEEQEYPYEVWEDRERALAVHYGAADSPVAFAPSRVTVILDAAGRAVGEYRPVSSVSNHPGEALEDCRALFGPDPR